MRQTRRVIPIGAALCFLGASAALSLPDTIEDRAEAFATCSGRLKALAVHGRSHNRFEGDAIDRLAQEFALMHEALPHEATDNAPAGRDREWHGIGWGEVAWLLNEVLYSLDTERAERASRRLRRKIVNCTDMLMPGAPPGWVIDLTAVTRPRPAGRDSGPPGDDLLP